MAIFTEAERYGGSVGNGFAILDEAIYLTEEESSIYPADVPVAENTRLGRYTVKFDDIDALAESYGCDYIDAMLVVAEHNGIDPSSMAVVVDEADIIADPNIVYGLANVVVAPISENSVAARYCNAVVDAYMESGNDEFLYYALVEDTELGYFLEEDEGSAWKDSKEYAGKLYNRGKDAVKRGWEWVKQATSKGRNWISAKISWLRSLYATMLRKANIAENNGENKGFVGTLKSIATKIANIIDALLRKLSEIIRNSDYKYKDKDGNEVAGGANLKAKQDKLNYYINGEPTTFGTEEDHKKSINDIKWNTK